MLGRLLADSPWKPRGGWREGTGLVVRSPGRRWLWSSRWEVKGPCWHGGIGKGEEEIHSDGFSPQGQVTKVTMGQMEAGPHLSSGNLDLFSTDGHESPTYLSGLLRR